MQPAFDESDNESINFERRQNFLVQYVCNIYNTSLKIEPTQLA